MKKYIVLLMFGLAGVISSLSAEDAGTRLGFGAVGSLAFIGSDQKASYLGNTAEVGATEDMTGVGIFLDIGKYVTLNAGARFALGEQSITAKVNSATATKQEPWTVYDYELGLKVKYPFALGNRNFLAPTLGIDWTTYAGGTQNGYTPTTSDDIQNLSPLMITLGLESTYYFDDHIFVRFPLDLGFALNSKLSDSYYYPGTYTSSYTISLSVGLGLGYTF